MTDEIRKKAEYCLNCKLKPCSKNGCPLNNDIPTFIKQLKEEKYEQAYETLTNTTVLQAICGRICPHLKQCQGSCVRKIKGEPVEIGELEAFIGDYAIKNNFKIKKKSEKINKRIAIVGGGPAGLTCAAFLAKAGAEVTIYEKNNYLGGLLVYGIPEFRLPKHIVKSTIQKILDLGIEVKYNKKIGQDITLKELENEYDFVFLAFGANVSLKMGIEGECLEGVYGANELLEYNCHPKYEGKTVLVNGGGNVAIDVARTVKRLGAKDVIIVYRREEEQMPAEDKEVEYAKNEGIQFWFKNNILKIKGNKKVEKVELIKTKLVQKENETRPSPINVEGTNYELNVDYVIMALGSKTEKCVENLGLELTSKGFIKIDENYKTSNPKVYAGGDITERKAKTVAFAARAGRDVAENILENI